MSHHHHPDPAAERAARRERLRLLCAADRTRLRLVWRLPSRLAKHEPEHEPDHAKHAWVGTLLTGPALGALLPLVPGRIGAWSRRIRAGAGLFRAVLAGRQAHA